VSDGDVIVVNGDDRLRIVRRREGVARIVLNREKGYAVLLVDHATDAGSPDGHVDQSFTFNGIRSIDGEWPLDTRWEGQVTLEEMTTVGEFRPMHADTVSVSTARGVILFLGAFPPGDEAAQPSNTSPGPVVATVRFIGTGRGFEGGAGAITLDEAERWTVAQAENNRSSGGMVSSGVNFGGAGSFVQWGQVATPAPRPGRGPIPAGAVRVGGTVRPPRKLTHVDPVYPDDARKAGVRGAVILELTIGADGTVSDARVLRSIPLLDAAAVDAVRQWVYEPTLVEGRAVPVIMTAPVQVAPIEP
jgi:protein TonB